MNRRRGRPRTFEADVRAALAASSDGATAEAIAQQTGASIDRVRGWLSHLALHGEAEFVRIRSAKCRGVRRYLWRIKAASRAP
ncbi:MAG: hypothetical protein AB7P35_17780 [Hyphomonadaceae bacterium]